MVEKHRQLLLDLNRYSCGTFGRIIELYEHGTIEDDNTPNSTANNLVIPTISPPPPPSPPSSSSGSAISNDTGRRDTWSSVDRDEEDYFSSATSDEEEEGEARGEADHADGDGDQMMITDDHSNDHSVPPNDNTTNNQSNPVFRQSPNTPTASPLPFDFEDHQSSPNHNHTHHHQGTQRSSPKSPSVPSHVDEVSEETLPLFHDDTI